MSMTATKHLLLPLLYDGSPTSRHPPTTALQEASRELPQLFCRLQEHERREAGEEQFPRGESLASARQAMSTYRIALSAILYASSASWGRRQVKRYLANVCIGTLSRWIISPKPLYGPAVGKEHEQFTFLRKELRLLIKCILNFLCKVIYKIIQLRMSPKWHSRKEYDS